MSTTDTARRQQRWRTRLDRVATVMVVTLSLIAVLTLLPQSWQQRLISWGCQGATFGVTDCVARLYEPPPAALRAVPQCDVDQVLEQMAPTVERQIISFATGSQLERWVARNGDIRLVALPEQPPSGSADGWDGDAWPSVTLLPGVDLPLAAQWTFPDGEGEREVIAALQQQHARRYQERSALAPLLSDTRAATAELTAPTTWWSRTPLTDVAEETSEPTPTPGTVRLSGTAATLLHDEVAEAVLTTVPASGITASGADVQGVVRWARLTTGRATELVGTWAWTEGGRTSAVHLVLPLADGDDDDFEAWLQQPDGPTLDLSFLRGEREPSPERPLERLVAAAGTVAYEEFDLDRAGYVDLTWQHLSLDRRPYGELPVERSVTELTRPQPSGTERAAQEIQC